MRWVIFGVALLSGVTCAVLWWSWTAKETLTTFRLAAGDAASESYDFARALAELVQARSATLRIEVLETGGAETNAHAVASATAQLGIVASDTILPNGVDAVATIFPEVMHLVVRDDAGIASPADFGGKRMGLMPWGSGGNELFLRVAQHYGLAAEDMNLQYMTPTLASVALANGQLDALVRVVALGNAGMRDVLKRDGVVLIGIDQAAAIQMFAPAIERVSVPRGALNGSPAVPPDDLPALAIRAVLVAAADLDPTVVAELTALLFEARNELVELDEQAALISGRAGLETFGFALHPGARRYYDADAPSFFVEYAEPIALGLSATVLAMSGLWQLRRWVEARRKNRGDIYNARLALLVGELREVTEPKRLDAIEDELYAMFQQVLADIDHDRLATDTLPTFDFVWRSATQLLARRRAALVAGASHASPRRHEPVNLSA